MEERREGGVAESLAESKDYEVWTDGGANNLSPSGEGAAAYMVFHDGELITERSKGFLHVTNNKMELLAVYSALCSIPSFSNVTVYTDSQYAIKVCKKGKGECNAFLIDSIAKRMSMMKSVKFMWVRGHSGEKNNERCDHLCCERMAEIRAKYGIPVYNKKNSPKVSRWNTLMSN